MLVVPSAEGYSTGENGVAVGVRAIGDPGGETIAAQRGVGHGQKIARERRLRIQRQIRQRLHRSRAGGGVDDLQTACISRDTWPLPSSEKTAWLFHMQTPRLFHAWTRIPELLIERNRVGRVRDVEGLRLVGGCTAARRGRWGI